MNNIKKKRKGILIAIQDSLVKARFHDEVIMGETAEIIVNGKNLQAEVLQIMPDPKDKNAGIAEMQVFEELTGALIGDEVEFTGTPLSVLLGPGLLTSIWDGLQNPLYKLSEQNAYLVPGMRAPALDEEKLWDFTPSVKAGDVVRGGDVIGTVPEGRLDHKILVPFSMGKCTIEKIIDSASITIVDEVAVAIDEQGKKHTLKLVFRQPVKSPIPFRQRSIPEKPFRQV